MNDRTPAGWRDAYPSRADLGGWLAVMVGYLVGQYDWTDNRAEGHRAGLRIGTVITEGTTNFLVNHRMNMTQQMHWIRHGADLLPPVRCAIYGGPFGPGCRQKFTLPNDAWPRKSTAA